MTYGHSNDLKVHNERGNRVVIYAFSEYELELILEVIRFTVYV